MPIVYVAKTSQWNTSKYQLSVQSFEESVSSKQLKVGGWSFSNGRLVDNKSGEIFLAAATWFGENFL